MDIAGTLFKVNQQRGIWGTNLCASAVNVQVTGTGTASSTSSRFSLLGTFIQKPSMAVGSAVCTDASGNAVYLNAAINSWLEDSTTGGICGAIIDVSAVNSTTVTSYTANLYLQFIGNGIATNITALAGCTTVAP